MTYESDRDFFLCVCVSSMVGVIVVGIVVTRLSNMVVRKTYVHYFSKTILVNRSVPFYSPFENIYFRCLFRPDFDNLMGRWQSMISMCVCVRIYVNEFRILDWCFWTKYMCVWKDMFHNTYILHYTSNITQHTSIPQCIEIREEKTMHTYSRTLVTNGWKTTIDGNWQAVACTDFSWKDSQRLFVRIDNAMENLCEAMMMLVRPEQNW